MAVVVLMTATPARAVDDHAPSGAALEQLISELVAARHRQALPLVESLRAGTLRIDAKGRPFVQREAELVPLLDPPATTPEPPIETPIMTNQLRRVVQPAIASLSLSAEDLDTRRRAAEELAKRPSAELEDTLRAALERETDDEVRSALRLALAQLDVRSPDTARRLAAAQALRDAADPRLRSDIEALLGSEDDPEVRAVAQAALTRTDRKVMVYGALGHLFYGISLGSVLIIAALGLAITFGVMRVINMAHGEMLMLGAYSTFVVQNWFRDHLPQWIDASLIVAIPVAFAITCAVGILLERTVIRFLYGRPLETLLATWGIALILIQAVRLVFGAQNVTVANPSWLSGGVELLPSVVLTHSRLAVIVFSVLVVTFVWAVLQKTHLGLMVRAVTQNREMAASIGIATRRVDMWTFGVGSGVAGLGGVALSQIGNVGPELGQTYIVDSFMVVVLGGVGKLAGTVLGAAGLGLLNKFLEPAAGAVLGKIAILAFIILFIQKRPQGLFALKGRAAEVV